MAAGNWTLQAKSRREKSSSVVITKINVVLGKRCLAAATLLGSHTRHVASPDEDDVLSSMIIIMAAVPTLANDNSTQSQP